MTRWLATLGVALALGACSSATSAPDGDPFVSDASFRRAALEESLVDRSNGYARLRLARYATGRDGDWDRLTEWNPRVVPVTTADLGTDVEAPVGTAGRALDVAGPDLLALGREAFFRYPVQAAPQAKVALVSAEAATRYGLWQDDALGVGGLVRAANADGTTSLSVTCATCHTARHGGALLVGAGNGALEYGRMLVDAWPDLDAKRAAAYLAFGPGRLDVTTTDASEPVRIPDLRPVRFLTHLHHDATVAQKSTASLAVRLETLLVTSSGQTLRPPHVVALALATYVRSLADTIPARAVATDSEKRGAALFASRCAGCHAGEGLTGAPVPLDVVGTDPHLGRSPDRGTGNYRVPSLRGVGTRATLFHDASLADLESLFDPARTGDAYAGGRLGKGPVRGHVFGLDLAATERGDLVAFLYTL